MKDIPALLLPIMILAVTVSLSFAFRKEYLKLRGFYEAENYNEALELILLRYEKALNKYEKRPQGAQSDNVKVRDRRDELRELIKGKSSIIKFIDIMKYIFAFLVIVFLIEQFDFSALSTITIIISLAIIISFFFAQYYQKRIMTLMKEVLEKSL